MSSAQASKEATKTKDEVTRQIKYGSGFLSFSLSVCASNANGSPTIHNSRQLFIAVGRSNSFSKLVGKKR